MALAAGLAAVILAIILGSCGTIKLIYSPGCTSLREEELNHSPTPTS